MSRNLPPPYFSLPPDSYEKNYFDDLGRNFAVFVHIMSNPGEERATKMTLTNLPTNDSSLEVGALFEQNSHILITKANTPHPEGLEGTGSVGSVTVTTS